MGSAFVDSDHDVGSLDHGVGGLATFQLEIVHRFVGDRCGHNRSADIDAHMGRRLTFCTASMVPFRTFRALSFIVILFGWD